MAGLAKTAWDGPYRAIEDGLIDPLGAHYLTLITWLKAVFQDGSS